MKALTAPVTPRTAVSLTAAPATRFSLADAIEVFWRRCRAKNLSPNTITFYQYRLEAFNRYLAGRELTDLALEDITPDLLRGFLVEQRESVSPLTASHSYVTLRCLFRFLAEEELLATNPMARVEPVRQPRKLMPVATPDQVQAMLAAIPGRGFVPARMRAILIVLFDTGLRRSELCGLRLQDLDLEQGTLRVTGKGDKQRLVFLGEVARQALDHYLLKRGSLPGQDRLFVNTLADPLTPQQLDRLLRQCGERAGLPLRVTPHVMRRAFAVAHLKNGGNVFALADVLGHSTLEMSRRYARLADCDLAEIHRRTSPADRLNLAALKSAGRRRLQ